MDNAQRQIVAAMVVTAVFAAVGEYANPQSKNPPDPFKVILGASLATAILVGMAELGEGPEAFAKGLATIAVLSATLVYGGPVWKAVSGAVASSSSSPSAKAAAPTTPTN